VPAAKDGAYLFTGTEWRWVPRYFLDRVRVDRRVTFGATPAGAVEPLVAWGGGEAADAVYVRHVAPGRVAIGLARWRGEWTFGSPGAPVSVAGPLALGVTVDRASGHVAVDLDRREAFATQADLVAIPRSSFVVGRSPAGRPLGSGSFSGRLDPP
jgi:hypothetical protein